MKHSIFTVMLAALCLSACSEEKWLEPGDVSDEKPQQVSNVVVTPEAGGATIKFRMPEQQSVLGAKAIYTITNGRSSPPSSSAAFMATPIAQRLPQGRLWQ